MSEHSTSTPTPSSGHPETTVSSVEGVPSWIWMILGGVFLFIVITILFKGCGDDESSPSSSSSNQSANFPSEGYGTATMTNPIRAYLDPMSSYTRVLGEGDAKFVFASDPSIYFIVVEKPETVSPAMKTWWKMPRGDYYVYPYGRSTTIDFRWWQ